MAAVAQNAIMGDSSLRNDEIKPAVEKSREDRGFSPAGQKTHVRQRCVVALSDFIFILITVFVFAALQTV